MNPGFERLGQFVAFAALLAVLTHLYFKTASPQDSRHQRVEQELDTLLHVDADLQRDALRVRTHQLQHYDSLNAGIERLAEGLERLRAEGRGGVYGEAAPEIERRLAQLSRSLAATEERLETFKASVALLHNSLLYLPTLQHELAASGDAARHRELAALAGALLRFVQSPGPEPREVAETILGRLLAARVQPPGQSEALRVLAAHARLVLEHGSEAEAALLALLTAPPGDAVRAAEKAYLDHHRRVQERANVYGTLLYCAALLVLASLAYALFRLGATSRRMRKNVAKRQRAEEALHQSNQTLERRVAERTAELERLAREREAFSYSIAHDVRSPLGVISGFCHLLRKDEQERLSPEGRRMLRLIETNAERLVMLVDHLLALAQVSHANFERKPIDLAQIAAAAAEGLRARYPAARIDLDWLPKANGDAALLLQVFSNLLENALKYSSLVAAPQVRVGWKAAARVCYVGDNGIGFDMRHADKLFTAFERLHADERFPGAGIGLAIVKRAVERHRGRIWADSAPGRGATFYFSLEPAPG